MLPYVPSKLGRTSNSMDIQLLKFPTISSPVEMKTQAFNFFSDAIEPHLQSCPFGEVSSYLKSEVPVSSSSAMQETLSVGKTLRQAFRLVTNSSDHAFLDSDGDPIALSLLHLHDVSMRPADIATYRFRATIYPSKFHPALETFPPQSFLFSLALPQSQVAPADSDPTNRALFRDLPVVVTINSLQNDFDAAGFNPDPTATIFDAIGLASGTDIFSNYTIDVINNLTQKQQRHLGKRSRLNIESEPRPMATVSPTMRRILRGSTHAAITTFSGSFNFTDDQEAFDKLFPFMASILPTDVTSDPAFAATWSSFIDHCCNRTLLYLLRLDYVGTLDVECAMSTLHITNSIRALRTHSYDKAKKQYTTLTPDELYESYVELVPLLPSVVASWGLTLAHQYHSALSDDLKQRLARAKEYTLPDPAELSTKVCQLAALRTLRRFASLAQRELTDETRTTNRLIQTSLQRNPRTNAANVATPPPPPPPPTTPLALVSPAEATMRRYSPPSNPVFSVDPVTKYICRHPNDFRGCLGCGNANHVFKQCPDKDDLTTKQRFFRELFGIKPFLRKRPVDETEMAFVRQLQQQNAPALPIQATATAPSTPANPAPPRAVHFAPAGEEQPSIEDTSPHLFAAFVPIDHEQSETNHPLPVAIDNRLPHISIQVGGQQDPSGAHHLSSLLDTGAALNTGFLPFHLWFASMYPHCVADLIHCDDPHKPFAAARLLGAVADRNTLSTHGRLTAVIRYFTPYTQTGNDNRPVILSFALGPDVTVNSIIGLPTIDSFNLSIDLCNNRAHSSICATTFDIRRACISHGLPPGVSFDIDNFRRTSPRADASATSGFGFGDVTVNDTFDGGCLNRTLTYLPPDRASSESISL
jgi:hypothetical protein